MKAPTALYYTLFAQACFVNSQLYQPSSNGAQNSQLDKSAVRKRSPDREHHLPFFRPSRPENPYSFIQLEDEASSMRASASSPIRKYISRRGPNPEVPAKVDNPDTVTPKPKPTLKRKTQRPSVAATTPQSLEGWVSYPTEATVVASTKQTPEATSKAGACGGIQSYGISCAVRMDQCTRDAHCPGTTLCCMVGQCGYMCVNPKPPSDAKKKRRPGASSGMKQQGDRVTEDSTTAEGLKVGDIAMENEQPDSQP
ncbi:uncharacterized protein LOC108677272 [Hyalella azteca]|uniref:Uncharacterized protein LOC108677272 n=1 Tax=Hyalella azteca TaxID=294128 RepID=A0A8B7P4J0_HYAAZ|nr:uncharacterized protein LOC108677272 [Hyalella azteca]